jgi:hypothetical protein
LVEGVNGVGLLAIGVTPLEVTHTQLVGADTWQDIFGMGVYVHSEVERAVVTLDGVWALDGRGAGFANKSSDVTIKSSVANCHAPALVGDAGNAGDYAFADAGENVCGCRDAVETCKVLSVALVPPNPL